MGEFLPGNRLQPPGLSRYARPDATGVTMRRALKWLGIAIGTLVCLVLVLGVGLYFFNWNWVRGALNAEGTKASGRQFAVKGDMGVHFFARHPWTPEIHLAQVQVGNPSWAKKPNMVQIGFLDFKIDLWQLLGGRIVMPELTLDTPVIDLEKPDADRKNWSMSSASPGGAAVNTTVPKNRTEVPVIGQLVVKNGTLSYTDTPSKLDVTTHIDTVVGSGGDNAQKTLQVKGNGTVQNEPFTVDMTGGSLLTLRDPKVRYPISFHLSAGATVFDAKGTMTDPVNMAGIDMRLDVKGDSLAKIFPFTAIPLPPTPNFEISGHLTKEGDLWTFADFKGGVGHSDLEGILKYDSSHAKPDITANLTSKLLDRQDLAGFIGAGPAQNPAQGGEKPKSQGVIPNVPINLERLRAANLDVTLRAEHFNDPSLPLQNMDTRFVLKDGDLKVDPLKFGIADGTIGGTLDLDGRQDVPKVTTDLTLSELSLKSFFTSPQFKSLSAGRFGGRVQLTGDGKSLHDVLSDSDGRITIAMSGGQISALMINAADLDGARALGNILGTDKPTPLRCVVADFEVQRGMMVSKIFDIDTGLSNIYGTANIDFQNEGLDITIEGHPKKPTPLAATAPITITGTMKNPSFGLKGGPLGARGVVAAALGVLLPPLAILPFIETGVGKDSDCADLIHQAQAHAAEQAQAPGSPPQDQAGKPVPGAVPPPEPGKAPVINDTSRMPSTTGNPTR